jgi:hypothetical protein
MSKLVGLRTIGSDENNVTSKPAAATSLFACARAATGPMPDGFAANVSRQANEMAEAISQHFLDRILFTSFPSVNRPIGSLNLENTEQSMGQNVSAMPCSRDRVGPRKAIRSENLNDVGRAASERAGHFNERIRISLN